MRKLNILLAFVLSVCAVFNEAHTLAIAEEITYTEVLTDLQKDSSFNADNYPTKADDYSLQIIQLAESVNKELFVYVYQPSGKAKDFNTVVHKIFQEYRNVIIF